MDELVRKIQIGFMDSIPLEKRRRLINSGISVSEVLKMYPGESCYLIESQDTVDWLNKGLGNIIWFGDADFPVFQPIERKLPSFLLYKGRMLNSFQRAISIVGTRDVDNDGFQAAFKLGLEAGANQIAVVSGMAEGCDQASMIGAISAQFQTFGVLGCGLEYDYPKRSEKMKERIIELGGGLISRFSPHCPPLKFNFPNRNLIIAAMGNVTLVVQAPKKSGSLITAEMALELGKEVYVSNAGIGNYWARLGTNKLYEDGALSVDSLSDYFPCDYRAQLSDKNSDIRFGSRHYFLRSLN